MLLKSFNQKQLIELIKHLQPKKPEQIIITPVLAKNQRQLI